MKKLHLDKEERQTLKDFEDGKYKPVKNMEQEKARYQRIAQATLKSKNINIRLTERDLQRVKTKAAKRGLPYQTLVAALIHQYADDMIEGAL